MKVTVQIQLYAQAESQSASPPSTLHGQVHTKLKRLRDNLQALLLDLGINQLVRLSANLKMPTL